MAEVPAIPHGVVPKILWALEYHPWVWLLIGAELMGLGHFEAGAVFLAIFIANLIVVDIWQRISTGKTTRRRQLAYGLIVAGLVLLISGIVLLGRQTAGKVGEQEVATAVPPAPQVIHEPPSQADIDKATAPLREKLAEKDRELAAARQQSVPSSSPPVAWPPQPDDQVRVVFPPLPNPTLTKNEANEIIDHMSVLAQRLRKSEEQLKPPGMAMSLPFPQQMRRFPSMMPTVPGQQPPTPPIPPPQGFSGRAAEVDKYRQRLEEFAKAIDSELKADNARYEDTLALVLGIQTRTGRPWPIIADLTDVLQEFSKNLGVLAGQEQKERVDDPLILAVLKGPSSNFAIAFARLQNWREKVLRERLPAARENAEQALKR
jgi:hypothetical protein